MLKTTNFAHFRLTFLFLFFDRFRFFKKCFGSFFVFFAKSLPKYMHCQDLICRLPGARENITVCEYHCKAGPVAQSVERWTPYGGSICPGFKSPGFEARRAPDVYRASWRVWLRLVAGRSQLKSAIGTGRARLCAYVKLSSLNSAIDPELRDRKVEDRANATSSA